MATRMKQVSKLLHRCCSDFLDSTESGDFAWGEPTIHPLRNSNSTENRDGSSRAVIRDTMDRFRDSPTSSRTPSREVSRSTSSYEDRGTRLESQGSFHSSSVAPRASAASYGRASLQQITKEEICYDSWRDFLHCFVWCLRGLLCALTRRRPPPLPKPVKEMEMLQPPVKPLMVWARERVKKSSVAVKARIMNWICHLICEPHEVTAREVRQTATVVSAATTAELPKSRLTRSIKQSLMGMVQQGNNAFGYGRSCLDLTQSRVVTHVWILYVAARGIQLSCCCGFISFLLLGSVGSLGLLSKVTNRFGRVINLPVLSLWTYLSFGLPCLGIYFFNTYGYRAYTIPFYLFMLMAFVAVAKADCAQMVTDFIFYSTVSSMLILALRVENQFMFAACLLLVVISVMFCHTEPRRSGLLSWDWFIFYLGVATYLMLGAMGLILCTPPPSRY